MTVLGRQRSGQLGGGGRKKRRLGRSVRVGSILVLGLVWTLPVYLVLINAAKPTAGYSVSQVWTPSTEFSLVENMVTAWNAVGLGESVASTLLYSLVTPTMAALIGAAAGFAIVALRLKNGFAWFMVIFGAAIFPVQMVLMPLFVGYASVDLYDTRLGMILVYTAVSIPFSALVMRNYYSSIARSMYEAGVVDGASPWAIFWHIYLPLGRSALLAIFILQAAGTWNEVLLGLTLARSDGVRPVMVALSGLQSIYGGATIPVVLAGALIVSVPLVILILATQKIFARGLSLGQY